MTLFLKLNFISALYALVYFVQSQLILNIYRLKRITGWTNMHSFVNWTNGLIFISTSILFFFLTKKLLGNWTVRYLTCFLWIPYYVLYLKVFTNLYPIVSPAEKPLPAVGLVLLATDLAFPIYIALINFIACKRAE